MNAWQRGVRSLLRKLTPCRVCSGRGRFHRIRRLSLGLVERCSFCDGKGHRLFGGAR